MRTVGLTPSPQSTYELLATVTGQHEFILLFLYVCFMCAANEFFYFFDMSGHLHAFSQLSR